MQKINFVDLPSTTTPISASNLNAIQTNTENAIAELNNVELIAVSGTAPSQCSTGDKYYNTSTKKIYTATGTNTWGSTGVNPTSGILYIVYDDQASYSFDGTDLVSVGGGKEDIVIGSTQPTDPDVKLWINTGAVSNSFTEITNYYSSSTGKGYSANYINGLHTYSTTEQRIGTWLDKPLYRKVFEIPQTSINSSDVTVINFNLADTNYVTKIEGMIGVTTSNTYYPIFGSPNRANVGYQVRRVSGAIQIIVDQTMSAESSIKGGQMIVEYTKTTD